VEMHGGGLEALGGFGSLIKEESEDGEEKCGQRLLENFPPVELLWTLLEKCRRL